MNTSHQKVASSYSPLATAVFIINIILFSITLIGYVLCVSYLSEYTPPNGFGAEGFPIPL